jgi:hypothetical protein
VLKNLNFTKIELQRPSDDSNLSECLNYKMQQKGFNRQQQRMNLINITCAKSKSLMQREYQIILKEKMGIKLKKEIL